MALYIAVADAQDGKTCRLNAQIALPQHRSELVDYSVNPGDVGFFVWAPKNYNGSKNFGLMVYINALEQTVALPPGWQDVLTKREMLFVSPQNAGNNSQQNRRRGMAVIAALEMQRYYKIDPSRIVVAGISGGARTASDLGFCQSDVFRGTIQDCGSNFYRKVASREATSWIDTAGYPYGVVPASAAEVAQARAKERFCLITGTGDFRRGNLRDIYNDGFAREGYRAQLFDVPGMGHQDCDAATLDKALDFVLR